MYRGSGDGLSSKEIHVLNRRDLCIAATERLRLRAVLLQVGAATDLLAAVAQRVGVVLPVVVLETLRYMT